MRIGLPPYNPLGGWSPNPHFFTWKCRLSEGTRPFSGVWGWPRFVREHEILWKRLKVFQRRLKRRRR